MIGRAKGRSPVTRCSSEWHIPEAANLTRTSPGPGGSSSISSTLHGAPSSQRIAACVFITTPFVAFPATQAVRDGDSAATLAGGRRRRGAEDGLDVAAPVVELCGSAFGLDRGALAGQAVGERRDVIVEQAGGVVAQPLGE